MFDFFKRKKKDPLHELKGLLGSYEVQSFPTAVMSALSLLNDPESSMPEIASQVESDPGMHLKVLRMVNSAGFGLMKKVSNINHAVTIMGRSRLEALILSFAVSESLPTQVEGLEMSVFWTTAARRGSLARMLAKELHAATQAESFTAALLQDLAIPLIVKAKKEEYMDVFQRWHQDPQADLAELELEQFGYCHTGIGGLMAEDWELPDYLVQAIAGHHDLSSQSPAEPAVRLVSLIKYYPEDDGSGRFKEAAHGEFGIDLTVLDEMLAQSQIEAEAFARDMH
jgi:HD-like signal output (HDOD) protein